MESFNTLWAKTLSVLENKMNDKNNKIGFTTWIKELKPEFIEDHTFYFEAATDIHKDIVTQRFKNIIEDSMREIAKDMPGFSDENISAVFLTHNEITNIKSELEENKNRIHKSKLNPNYTFDTFVKGSSNEFAYAVARAVSQMPGKSYNPLFIYGGVGLGKTHLMHAIGNEIADLYPSYKIEYVTCETFTNELIDLLQTKQNISIFRINTET